MTFDLNQPRGQVLNRAQFREFLHSDPESTLVFTEDVAPGVYDGQLIMASFEHDGGTVHIARFPEQFTPDGRPDPTVKLASYQVFDETVYADLPDLPLGASEEHVFQAAAYAFDEKRKALAAQKLGQVAELDDAVRTEIVRLATAMKRPLGLAAPEGWDGETELHPISSVLFDDLNRAQTGLPVSAYANENSIVYTVDVPTSSYGEIITGPPKAGEKASKYRDRVASALSDETRTKLRAFFHDSYGLTLNEGHRMKTEAKLHMQYGESAETMTLERMAERVEDETRLLQLTTGPIAAKYRRGEGDLESGELQKRIAEALGYEPTGADTGAAWKKKRAAKA